MSEPAQGAEAPSNVQTHRSRRMLARRADEHGRVSTPLELLYDLTVVVAFSTAGSLFAHEVATGHALPGVVAFGFSIFAIVWAWIGFSWFASAFDNDDWVMRLATLLQMVGVIVLALGLSDLFHGFEQWELHNAILVAGYVTMRVAVVGLYLRAARHNPERRATMQRYAMWTVIAQCGWVATVFVHASWAIRLPMVLVLYAVEIGSVALTERSSRTPWHPHHIAERYGLLTIITFGEIILGTSVAVQALVAEQGWSSDAVLVMAAGISLAFGLWWVYFALPFGDALALQPERAVRFGTGHVPLFGAVAAIGAGLHVADLYVLGEEGVHIGIVGVILAIAIPLALFVGVVFWLAHLMLPGRDLFHVVLLLLSMIFLAAGVGLACVGASLPICLMVLLVVPWISVIGYETRGHGHLRRVLADLGARAT